MLITEGAGIEVVHSTAELVDLISTGEHATLRCPYCTAIISPDHFLVWPAQKRLMTGECDGCGRSVTLPSQWLTAPGLRQPSDDGDTAP